MKDSRITMAIPSFLPDNIFGIYLVHAPLSLLHAVWVLSLVSCHYGLLLHAHVAAIGQSPARHHSRAGWKSSAHSWRKPLCAELHLRLAQEHACSIGRFTFVV